MDVYGSLKELVSLILRKSGFQVTISAPTTVSKAYEYKLPNTDANSSAVLVTDTHAQTLTNKTLTTPVIGDFTNAGHDHSEASKGGQLGDSAIASGAAITRSKLANGTINHVVINSSGSGALSSEAQLAKSRGGFGMDISSLTPQFASTKQYKVDGSIASSVAGERLYKTISEAITAAVTAGAAYNNRMLICVAPGTYTENITMYDGVLLSSETASSVTVVGTISSHAGLSAVTALSGINGIDFIHQPSVPGVSFNLVGAVSTHLCTFAAYPTANVAITVLHAAPAAGQTMIHGLMTVSFSPLVAFTSNVDVLDANGAGALSIYTSSVIAQSAQSAGNICLVNESGSGVRNYNSILSYGIMTNAAYSGQIRGFCTESASTGSRLAQACQVRLEGAGSGTAIAFNLDTSTDVSDYFYTGCTCFIDGFANEYISYTSVNAVQKIWLNSVNKDLTKSGTGRSIITPYDEKKSGFVEWGAVSGGNYWSITGNSFTVIPAGVGVVRGAPVAFDANQSISLSIGVNYIYMDSSGVIGKSSSGGSTLYNSNIVLFQVWYDGTNTRIFKENHPYAFESAVSGAWHRLFGSLLEGTGATISTLSAAGRTIQSAGADTLTDHGLDTAIADSTNTAVSMTLVYRGVGGAAVIGSTVTAIPGQYNNGAALSDTPNFAVWRIVVAKDNLEGAAQYFAIANTSAYNNLSAANAAITDGKIAPIPAELVNCEVVMVGYVIIDGDGAGGGTIASTISSRKTFGASFLGGSPSSTANLVSITDIAGPIIDTASTVQSALEEVNTNAAKKAASSTDNAVARFDSTTGQLLQNSVVIIDDSGNTSGVGTLNSHAIPAGTDAFTTNDASQTLTNKTLTTPTIGNFTNSNHDHSDASKGGLIVAASATQQGAVTTAAQSFAGAKTFNDGVKTDTIAEKTVAAGVTIDSALIKDGAFVAASTDANKLPVGTSAQRSSADAGNIRHNSDLATVEFHDGTNWVPAVKVKTVSLINGTADLYTPETGVLAYEALVYSSVSTNTSLTKILVVNDNGTWTYSASEAGDAVVTIVVNTSTGKLSLTATGAGTCKSRIHVIL